jgi:hypothetical protein
MYISPPYLSRASSPFLSSISVTNTGLLGSKHVLVVRPGHLTYTGCLLYLVALLHLPPFFRFVVLV